jgi:amino acid transporter
LLCKWFSALPSCNIPLTHFFRIIFFNGFEVFTHKTWDEDVLTNFFTAYIGIPIFFGLYTFWKLFKRTKFVQPADADITTGKAALDAEVWPEQIPRNLWEKFWFWLV